MGLYLFDLFSILHFSVGGLWSYIGFDLISLIILHILFEYIENTKYGMNFINKYITLWPVGKPHADSIINSTSDVLFSIFGWVFHKYFSNNYKSYANKLILFYISNILFYWITKYQTIIILILSFIIVVIYNKIDYYVYILIGFLIGYFVEYIDKKYKLYK